MISQFKSKVGALAQKFGRFGKKKTFKMKAQDALAKTKKFAKKNKGKIAAGVGIGSAAYVGGKMITSKTPEVSLMGSHFKIDKQGKPSFVPGLGTFLSPSYKSNKEAAAKYLKKSIKNKKQPKIIDLR